MYRKFFLIGLAFFIINGLHAQLLSISGAVVDQQNKAPLTGATAKLNSVTDSAFIRTVVSDSLGRFSFTGLQRDSFLLTISFIGYNPVLRGVRLDTTDISLDINAVANSSQELATVVIRSTSGPVQKGDTLQISANQFKVNPDASGEDLIRKVPGVTIENGQVKAQGENVQKVTIDKIQIFDRLSDQAQFTGFEDGNTSKSINIVTKANMRNGQFGRVFAGYGTDERYAAGGNATILKENRKISLVGNFNNTNQQNFAQQDLLGVTSTNNQRGSGGFRGGGGNRVQTGNRGQGGGNPGGGNFGGFGNNNNFLVGQQNGINKTNAFGINYSDLWGPKITMTGSYFFNNTSNNTNEIANTQYYSGGGILDTTASSNTNTNHRFNMRFEYRIDSANQIIISPNLSFQDNNSERHTNQITFDSLSSLQRRISQNNTNSSRSGNNLNNPN